ncbi:hypothetical protein ABH908_000146 [Pseudomonas frederiksbergensis]|uniref:hypothetical protein n=1 Tax=Pseudomonas TaxID=286 RepID=UPI003D208BB4
MQTLLGIAFVLVSLLCLYLIRKVGQLSAYHGTCNCCLRERPAVVEDPEASQLDEKPSNEAQPASATPYAPSQSWINHAYPLNQLTIKLQGTRHSSPESIVALLGIVSKRLAAGVTKGYEHDDDFGYHFEWVKESPGPSFFDGPAGLK